MSIRRVLLVTYSGDRMADLVTDALRARDTAPVRLDTDRFPHVVTVQLRQGPRAASIFRLGGNELSSIDAVWYRRFFDADLPKEVEEKYVRHCRRESRMFLNSLFASLRGAHWVDPIPRVHLAHHKALQLDVAKRCGFEVPETLMTNDPADARRFFDALEGRVVTKMLSSFALHENEVDLMVFTRTVTEEDLKEIEGLKYCPMVFQERVEKDVELRVTVVGDRIFVSSIDAKEAGVPKDDWRRRSVESALRFRKDSVPGDVEEATLRLMRAYGLVYGAIDLIRTPDERHVFLEINSAGEWGWIHTEVGHPVAEALADVLSGRVEVDRRACELS